MLLQANVTCVSARDVALKRTTLAMTLEWPATALHSQAYAGQLAELKAFDWSSAWNRKRSVPDHTCRK